MQNDSFFDYILSRNNNPTILLDENTKVICFNQITKTFIKDLDINVKISSLLNNNDTEIIYQTISETIKYEMIIFKKVVLSLAGSENCELLLSKFYYQQNQYYYLSFNFYGKSLTRFVPTDTKLENLPINNNIIQVINNLIKFYPYSLINKTKLSNEIDGLSEKIWIKNDSNRYVLVNKSFSTKLGISKDLLEGNETNAITKTTGIEFAKDVDYYLFKYNINIKLISEVRNLDNKPIKLYKIPIIINNKVAAIINFAEDLILETNNLNTNSGLDEFVDLCIIDENNKVISYNPDLSLINELFEGSNIHKKFIGELFDDEFVSEIERYRNNFREKRSHEFIHLYRKNGEVLKEFKVILSKIITGNMFTGNISIKINNINTNTKNNKVNMNEIQINIIPQPVFIYEIDNLRFLDVNDSALNLYGYKRNEFLKLDLTDLYTPEDIQTLLETNESINRSDIYTGPIRQKRSSGETILVEIYKKDIVYNGKNAHITFIRKFEEKTKNEFENTYKLLLDNTSSLVFIIDNAGFIKFANKTASDILEYNKLDLETRPMISLISDDNRSKFNSLILNSTKNELYDLEIDLKSKSGKRINSIAKIFKEIKNNQVETYTLIINIIPEPIIKIEKEIIEKPVASTGSLDIDFLSHLFHEILTPINVIKGFAQELSESIINPTEEQEEAINIINENQKLLMRILDNASEYVALETRQIEVFPEQVVFIEIIDDIQNKLKELLLSQNKSFAYGKISSSLAIQTDKYKLITLLNLFFTFALNQSKENKIYISAYSLNPDEGIITVKDNNIGITPELLKKLKDILTLDESTIRKNYGISRFTVRLLQKLLYILSGKVEEITKAGKISELGIKFPLRYNFSVLKSVNSAFETPKTEIPEPEIQPVINQDYLEYENINKQQSSVSETIDFTAISQPSKAPYIINEPHEEIKSFEQPLSIEDFEKPKEEIFNLNNYSCLYLEDQIDSQILFKSQMKDLKSISFAESFENAIPLLEKNKFDFIVMDMNLQGDYNGLDALRAIQRMVGYKNVPVIAVTAYVLPGDREKFIKAGFSDFISKPIMRDKLIDVLKRIFT